MKRSDAIDSIVYHCLSWDGLDTSGVPVEEIANDVLTHLEKLGMLPPRYTYIPGNPDIISELGSGIKHEWEPEELIVTNVDVENKTVTFKTVTDE
jgi:hypothetical protein